MTSARIDPYEEGWPPGVKPPPRGCDLPYDDGEPMETGDHRKQMDLLAEVFTSALEQMGREDVFVAGNMALYYSALQAKNNDFKAPDVFVVLDTTPEPGRKSWVVWEEDGRTPNIVVELLSETTEADDRGPKRRVYERVLRVPDYFVYDPIDFRLEGWHLEDGQYRAIEPDAQGRLYCKELGLWLGRWRGRRLERESTWLRLFDQHGRLIPTYAEAEAERANAEAERADAEAERARVAEARVAELMAQLGRER
jgi:Uma2 family endonuclease